MRRSVMWFFIAVLLYPGIGYTHSPENIEAAYSFEDQILTVSMEHVSNDKNDHFIRKLLIMRSGKVLETEYYPKQEDIRNVVKNIPIVLESGESIVIKAYSKEGGIEEINFTVPDLSEEESE